MLSVLHRWSRRHRQSERGATAVEYALLLAFIASVIVGIVAALGQTVNVAINSVSPGF